MNRYIFLLSIFYALKNNKNLVNTKWRLFNVLFELLFFVSVMFLFYLIFFLLSNRIHAMNYSNDYIPTIEEMYSLPMNNQQGQISRQFHQGLAWEYGNLPTDIPPVVEMSPIEPIPYEIPTGPGTIKNGHLFQTDDEHAYPIDRRGVHRLSEHHIFLVRHGKLK